MLNPKLLRDDPDLIRKALKRRGDTADIERLIELDEKRRQLITRIQDLKKQRNEISEQVGHLKKKGENPDKLMEQAKSLAQNIKDEEQKLVTVERDFEQSMLWIPNIPHG